MNRLPHKLYKALKEDCPRGSFNPWFSTHSKLDAKRGDVRRRKNLTTYFQQLAPECRTLFLGEAPGYRGCRFTGIPFLSEAQIEDFPMKGLHHRTSSLETPFAEVSGKIVRGQIDEQKHHALIWNIFPWHPHHPGNLLSNRTPTSAEIRQGFTVLDELVKSLPLLHEVVAIGRKAEHGWSLFSKEFGYEDIAFRAVRHPSHGGVKLFQRQMTQWRRDL